MDSHLGLKCFQMSNFHRMGDWSNFFKSLYFDLQKNPKWGLTGSHCFSFELGLDDRSHLNSQTFS